MKTFFWDDLQKKLIPQTLDASFLKSNHVGRQFARIFREFAQIFTKSKLLGLC